VSVGRLKNWSFYHILFSRFFDKSSQFFQGLGMMNVVHMRDAMSHSMIDDICKDEQT